MAKINISVEHNGEEFDKFEFINEDLKVLVGKEFKETLIGFAIIQTCFIALKLLGVNLGWLMVFSPAILVSALILIGVLVFGVIFILLWDSLIRLRDEYADIE